MKFSKSAVVAVAISGFLLAGCSAEDEQPTSGNSVKPSVSLSAPSSATTQEPPHGILMKNGLVPYDLSSVLTKEEGYEAGNFDESKAIRIMNDDAHLSIVATTDNGVIITTESEGPFYVDLNGGKNLQLEPQIEHPPIIIKWEGKQYVGIISKREYGDKNNALSKDFRTPVMVR